MRFRTLLSTVLLAVIPFAASAGKSPAVSPLSAYVAKNFPDFYPGEFSDDPDVAEDLDGDGLPEKLYELYSNKDNNEIRFVVFKGMPAQSSEVVLLAASKPAENCMHGYEISAKKGVLEFSCFHSSVDGVNSWRVEKFAIRKGRLRLIGEENFDSSQANDANPDTDPNFVSTSISTNYMTGDVITTQTKHGKTAVSEEHNKLSPGERKPKYFDDCDYCFGF